MEKLKIEKIGGSDLSTHFNCTCPSKLFKNTNISHIMKTTIRLYGYNDDYFFNEVNKEPRIFKCECGKKYSQQWLRDGVIVKKLK